MTYWNQVSGARKDVQRQAQAIVSPPRLSFGRLRCQCRRQVLHPTRPLALGACRRIWYRRLVRRRRCHHRYEQDQRRRSRTSASGGSWDTRLDADARHACAWQQGESTRGRHPCRSCPSSDYRVNRPTRPPHLSRDWKAASRGPLPFCGLGGHHLNHGHRTLRERLVCGQLVLERSASPAHRWRDFSAATNAPASYPTPSPPLPGSRVCHRN